MEGISDAHLLVAALHRRALIRLSQVSGRKQQGLAVAAKHLRLSSNWKRKARELDACLGITEKICCQSIEQWMVDLEAEMVRAKSSTRSPVTSESVDSQTQADELSESEVITAVDGSGSADILAGPCVEASCQTDSSLTIDGASQTVFSLVPDAELVQLPQPPAKCDKSTWTQGATKSDAALQVSVHGSDKCAQAEWLDLRSVADIATQVYVSPKHAATQAYVNLTDAATQYEVAKGAASASSPPSSTIVCSTEAISQGCGSPGEVKVAEDLSADGEFGFIIDAGIISVAGTPIVSEEVYSQVIKRMHNAIDAATDGSSKILIRNQVSQFKHAYGFVNASGR